MKELLLLIIALLLFSCEETGTKETRPTVDKTAQEVELRAVTTWCDSLTAAVGKFALEEPTHIGMKREQERLLPFLEYGKKREIYLTRDTLYIDGYPALSGENDFDDLPILLSKKSNNDYMTDHYADSLPWVVIFKATDDAKTDQLWRIIPHLNKAGYHYVAFVAKVSDLPPLPSIPDSGYFNWILEKLSNTPAARYATEFANIATERFRLYSELMQLFDASANIPAMERLPYLCTEFPSQVIGKEDRDLLLTLLYTKGYRYRLRYNALARTFKIEQGGTEVTLPYGTSMSELYEKLMREEALEIRISQEL